METATGVETASRHGRMLGLLLLLALALLAVGRSALGTRLDQIYPQDADAPADAPAIEEPNA